MLTNLPKTHAEIFFICPIGGPESLQRQRSNFLATHVCEPVALQKNLEFVRADRLIETGLIIDQIVWHLLNAKIVIADLAGGNPNVMYELAIRHTTGKPCICLGSPSEKIPYNIAPLRVFNVDVLDENSIDKMRESLLEIINMVDNSERGPKSPISEALGHWRLKADPFSLSITDLQFVFENYGSLKIKCMKILEEKRKGVISENSFREMKIKLDYLEGSLQTLSKKFGHPSIDSYVRYMKTFEG